MKKMTFHWAAWGGPIVMALLSFVGLLSALLGDGVWDWASWIGLGIPTTACCWYGLRRPAAKSGS
jgi:hypothetical protein